MGQRPKVVEPRRGVKKSVKPGLYELCRRSAARKSNEPLPETRKASKSLALGLPLTAAPQLVEGSRLISRLDNGLKPGDLPERGALSPSPRPSANERGRSSDTLTFAVARLTLNREVVF